MLDVILVPDGEQTKVFDLGLALDRDYPMQAAVGMISPVAVVPNGGDPVRAFTTIDANPYTSAGSRAGSPRAFS